MSNSKNALSATSSKTMSSTEIAELTGKEKKTIHRDIKEQILVNLYNYDLKDGTKLHHLKIQGLEIVFDSRGYWQEVLLDRYHTDILISGYEVKYRAAIVKRWHELETQQPALNPANLTRMQLIQIALEAEQELQEANAKIEVLEPKAEALDRIATATQGSMCLTDAAKTLQQKPKEFIAILHSKSWIYKRTGSSHWVAYQDKIKSGYLEHKEKQLKLADGTDKMTCQVLVTAKGLAKLSVMLS